MKICEHCGQEVKSVRTKKQSDALHLWFGMVAETLNEAGLDIRKVWKPSVDIPWTKETVKEHLFKPVMKAITLKESTTELDRAKEIDLACDTMVRHLSKFAVELPPFPSVENQTVEK